MIDMEKVQEPKCFVYGLVDPETRLVFYVGQSIVGMKRPKKHHQRGWIFEIAILEAVNDPKVQVESLCPWWPAGRKPTALNELECYWIALGRALGWPLRNQTDGGYGMRPTPSTRARMTASHRGKSHPPEVRAKISAAKQGADVGSEYEQGKRDKEDAKAEDPDPKGADATSREAHRTPVRSRSGPRPRYALQARPRVHRGEHADQQGILLEELPYV